jgi:hypothetical protein
MLAHPHTAARGIVVEYEHPTLGPMKTLGQPIQFDGAPRVAMVTRYQCLLLDPATGKIGWSFPFGMRGPTVNAATPVLGDPRHLLVTASYGIGSVYAAFDDRGATPVWQGIESFASQYATPIPFAPPVTKATRPSRIFIADTPVRSAVRD